jgi:transcriptional regulator with XRE-family HTH domain
MSMPERSFGRTVRYRRTKLGLSQAQLAELVGRSTATVRAWERDKSRPNDAKVLSALAAILGVNERQLFEKAEVEPPGAAEEASPTVEQALASLAPVHDQGDDATDGDEEQAPASMEDLSGDQAETEVILDQVDDESDVDEILPAEAPVPDTEIRQPVAAAASPAYAAPQDRYVTTPVTPQVSDLSYMEDRSQRQLYRVRTLATLVALVALVVAFIWSMGESLGALGDWWDQFFGNLRL